MKFIVFVAALLASTGVWASEVGTHNPGKEETTKTAVKLALADEGTSTDWTIEPVDFQVTAHQIQRQERMQNKLNAQMSQDLEQKIEAKLLRALAL